MANPATEQAPEKPMGSPEHLAKTFSTDATQAHKELQDDLRCMTPSARMVCGNGVVLSLCLCAFLLPADSAAVGSAQVV